MAVIGPGLQQKRVEAAETRDVQVEYRARRKMERHADDERARRREGKSEHDPETGRARARRCGCTETCHRTPPKIRGRVGVAVVESMCAEVRGMEYRARRTDGIDRWILYRRPRLAGADYYHTCHGTLDILIVLVMVLYIPACLPTCLPASVRMTERAGDTQGKERWKAKKQGPTGLGPAGRARQMP